MDSQTFCKRFADTGIDGDDKDLSRIRGSNIG